MKAFKSLPIVIMILITIILSGSSTRAIINIPNASSRKTIKVGVLVYSDNVFSYSVSKNLQDIQKVSPKKSSINLCWIIY